jgi:hypothetical protein
MALTAYAHNGGNQLALKQQKTPTVTQTQKDKNKIYHYSKMCKAERAENPEGFSNEAPWDENGYFTLQDILSIGQEPPRSPKDQKGTSPRQYEILEPENKKDNESQPHSTHDFAP